MNDPIGARKATPPTVLVYGLPEGETREYMEVILYSKARTIDEAQKVASLLERDHGCTRTRVWEYRGDAPDFVATIARGE